MILHFPFIVAAAAGETGVAGWIRHLTADVVPLEQTECVYNVASEVDMPTYICLTRWTSKGLENVKDSPSRLDAARKAFQAAGVTLKDFYMVTGRYDMILIAEAPDDTTLAKAVLSVAVKGSIQTETLRAFTENEYRGIVSGL